MKKLIALTAAVLFSTAIVACTAEVETDAIESKPLPAPVSTPSTDKAS